MAHFRSIDSGIWANATFRRLPDRTQKVFLYLFSAAADDEGRFEPDADAILEAAFHRNSHMKQVQVTEALESLAECGLILLYEVNGQRYGFLTGWYEHQVIKLPTRHASKLPAPPCPLSSWAFADRIKAAFCQATGKDKQGAYWRDAQRAWSAGEVTVEGDSTETQVSLDSDSTNTQPDRIGSEGIGSDRKGCTANDLKASSSEDAEGPPEAPIVENPEPEAKPEKKLPKKPRVLTLHQEAIELAWAAHELGPLPESPLKGYSLLVDLVTQHGVPQVQKWAAVVSRDPPKVPEGADAWKWFWQRFRTAMAQPWGWDGSRDRQYGGMLPPGKPGEDQIGPDGRVVGW